MAILTPKYLTREQCEMAVSIALRLAMEGFRDKLVREQCHVVILVPAMEDARTEDYPDWPDYPVSPYALYERSLGQEFCERRYDEIAKCKAIQLWTGRNDGRSGPVPHLVFSGDTPFWGGVCREGIVVACSGVQPWFDRMIAGIAADVLIALARDAFENDPEVQRKESFLS